jgi:glycosyltransferase involved in cell wall biosynthesis
VVIPNGLDTATFAPAVDHRNAARRLLGLSEMEVVIGHVGRPDPQKDHRTLMAAFDILAARHADVRLVLIGSGFAPGDAYLESMIGDKLCAGRVLALGPRDDVATLLPAMDVFALSSWGEAFPNVVVEAMSCGVPCVSTDVGDAGVILGDTGWIVPPNDPSALANALDAAISEPSTDRRARGIRARDRVRTHFDVERMVSAYELMWDGMSRRRRASCAA